MTPLFMNSAQMIVVGSMVIIGTIVFPIMLFFRKKMNIYLLYNKEQNGYDEYDSYMVVAESEKEAFELFTHDSNYFLSDKYRPDGLFGEPITTKPLKNFGILYIGKSVLQKKQILIGSFNAG